MTNHITTYLLILLLLLAGCNNSVKENPKADYDVIVIGAGAAGMYAALHLDKNDINVKVLEASSTHGGRAQYNESFSNGFITLGPEEVYNSPNYPIPLRAKAMQAFKRWASEEDKDTTQMEVRGDSVFVENKFFAILPDSARTRIDIYADLYKWDSTLLHPFELGEEFYNPFYEDHRERWGDWPYRGQNNYDDMDFHVGLKNIVYMKDGKRVNALEDNSYHDALRAARKIYRYDGPDTTESAVLNMELGIEEGDIEWILIEDLFAAGTSASSLNRMYTSKYPEFDEDEEEEEWRGYRYRDYGSHVFYVDLPYKQFLDTLYFHVLHEKELIKYNSPVVKVDYSNDVIVVTDENGVQYTANSVVSTVSVEVLKSEMIEFVPELPARKVEAYNKMSMDAGFRLYLKFKEPIWDRDEIVEIMGAGYSTRCWVPSKFRSEEVNDPNVLQCYIMGERADQLLAQDEDVATVVVKELDAVFGGTLASDNFVDAFYMDYKMNPYIRGIYSYTSAKGWYDEDGEAADDILAQPVNDKLFFGGEATYSSTVVGAMRTGLRCAEEILSLKEN